MDFARDEPAFLDWEVMLATREGDVGGAQAAVSELDAARLRRPTLVGTGSTRSLINPRSGLSRGGDKWPCRTSQHLPENP